MINPFPLKLMIDSRASSIGNSSAFSVNLPETLHLPSSLVASLRPTRRRQLVN